MYPDILRIHPDDILFSLQNKTFCLFPLTDTCHRVCSNIFVYEYVDVHEHVHDFQAKPIISDHAQMTWFSTAQ